MSEPSHHHPRVAERWASPAKKKASKRPNYKVVITIEDRGGDKVHCAMTFNPAVPGHEPASTPALHLANACMAVIGNATER
jgi:hypothetical protein